MGTVVATVDQAHASVYVLVNTREVRDSFTRSVVAGFGNASEFGGPWIIDAGVAADHNVVGSYGQHIQSTVNFRHRAHIGPSVTTIDLTASVAITGVTGVTTHGGVIEGGVSHRIDSSNYYYCSVVFNIDGTYSLKAVSRVGGVDTTLGTVVIGTYTFGTYYRVRMVLDGTYVYAKIWPASTSEPPLWTIIVNEIVTSLSGVKIGGLISIRAAGNTDNGASIDFDDFLIFDFQGLVTLNRVTPDGVSTPVRNNPVILSDGQALFYDDEAPLNTAVSYVATNQSGTVSLSSSNVIITGSGVVGQPEFGWLKDPIQPTNDVPLNFYLQSFDQSCVPITGVGVFNWSDESLADASGEFSRVDNAYPTTVAMKRKSAQLTLMFTTLQLSDITRLKNILASGRVLLLQVPMSYGWGLATYGSEYVHVRDIVIGRPNLSNRHHTERLWALPVTLELAPADLGSYAVGSNNVGGGRSTWGVMKASSLTWAQLAATGKTWTELAQGQGY